MALEALSTSELLNYIIYDTLSATPFSCNEFSDNNNNTNTIIKPPPARPLPLPPSPPPPPPLNAASPPPLDTYSCSKPLPMLRSKIIKGESSRQKKVNLTVNNGGARKKRRRRPKVCKNKEEAETQRMTHIAVERNRRKQMNEHLAVLRSLMPESYVQRGDQASIVGGAIEYVKGLEHVLQSLEAQKLSILQQGHGNSIPTTLPFGQFFSYPQYTFSSSSTSTSSQINCPNKYIITSNKNSKAAAAAAAPDIAEIEVTLIETHANVRVLSRRRIRQLSKLVSAFHSLFLTILHLNVTTFDSLVLYSISAKVEEGCQFSSSDEIAGAVHHVLRIIEEEAASILT